MIDKLTKINTVLNVLKLVTCHNASAMTSPKCHLVLWKKEGYMYTRNTYTMLRFHVRWITRITSSSHSNRYQQRGYVATQISWRC